MHFSKLQDLSCCRTPDSQVDNSCITSGPSNPIHCLSCCCRPQGPASKHAANAGSAAGDGFGPDTRIMSFAGLPHALCWTAAHEHHPEAYIPIGHCQRQGLAQRLSTLECAQENGQRGSVEIRLDRQGPALLPRPHVYRSRVSSQTAS